MTNLAVCHDKVVNQQFAACSGLPHDDESSDWYTIGCGRFLPCILHPTPLFLSDSLSDYTTSTNFQVLSSTVLNPMKLEILEPLHWLMF